MEAGGPRDYKGQTGKGDSQGALPLGRDALNIFGPCDKFQMEAGTKNKKGEGIISFTLL
jgi:hypothetical protein